MISSLTIDQPGRLKVAALVLQLPVLAFVVILGLTGSFPIATVCCLATLPTAILLATYLGAKHFDLFSPLLAVTLPVLFGITLRTIYLVFCKTGRAEEILHGYRVDELAPAVVIVGVGCASLALGYVLASQIRFELGSFLNPRGRWSRRTMIWLSIGCAILAVICTVDLLRRTGFQLSGATLQSLSAKRRVATPGSAQHFTTLGYHSWGNSFLPAFTIYACLAAGVQQHFRLPRACIVGMFCIVVMASFLSSDRMSICFLVMNIILILYYQQRISLAGISLAAVTVVLMLSSFVLIRDGVLTEQGIEEKATANLVLDTIVGNENFVDVVRVQRVHDGVPREMPYRYGEDFVSWLVAPVPRVYWEEKPTMSPGIDISRELYGGKVTKTEVEGARPPGLINQLIMNFGVWSVPLGMLLFGMGVRCVYNTLRPYIQVSPFAMLLYVSFYLPICFMAMEGAFARSMILLLQGVVTTYAFSFVAFRREARFAPLLSSRRVSFGGTS